MAAHRLKSEELLGPKNFNYYFNYLQTLALFAFFSLSFSLFLVLLFVIIAYMSSQNIEHHYELESVLILC